MGGGEGEGRKREMERMKNINISIKYCTHVQRANERLTVLLGSSQPQDRQDTQEERLLSGCVCVCVCVCAYMYVVSRSCYIKRKTTIA